MQKSEPNKSRFRPAFGGSFNIYLSSHPVPPFPLRVCQFGKIDLIFCVYTPINYVDGSLLAPRTLPRT